jgi:hypothetical protein
MSRADDRRRNAGRTVTPSYLKLVHDTTARPAPASDAPTDARSRIVIVPLDDPAGSTTSTAPAKAEPLPRLAPPVAVGERRQIWPGHDHGDPRTRLVCVACGSPARVDVIDLRTRRLHLSCDHCFRMWQDQVRVDDKIEAGVQKVH